MIKDRYFTKFLILVWIFCYIVLLGFTPLLHDHDHNCKHAFTHGHDYCHENEDEDENSESSDSEERCAVCVFLNTHIQYGFQTTTNSTPFYCFGTLRLTDDVLWHYKPTNHKQSRAPPLYSPNPLNALIS